MVEVGRVRSKVHGLTAVEVLVAATLVVVLIIAGVYFYRRNQAAQARGDAEARREVERRNTQERVFNNPHDVFAIRMRPLKATVRESDEVVLLCEIVNPTEFDLEYPAVSHWLHIEHDGVGKWTLVTVGWRRIDPFDGTPVFPDPVFTAPRRGRGPIEVPPPAQETLRIGAHDAALLYITVDGGRIPEMFDVESRDDYPVDVTATLSLGAKRELAGEGGTRFPAVGLRVVRDVGR